MKHVLTHSTRPRCRRVGGIVAVGLSAALGLSACGTAATTAEGSSPASTPSSAVHTSETATPTASPAASTSSVSGILTLPGVVNDGVGPTYLQTTISDADPDVKIPASAQLTQEVKAAFTEEQRAAAAKFVVRFVAEEYLDGLPANGGTKDQRERFMAAIKDRVDPEVRDEFTNDTLTAKDPSITFIINRRTDHAYKFANDAGSPRVVARDIRIAGVDTAQGRPEAILFTVDTNIAYTISRDGLPGKEDTSRRILAAAALQADGTWKISGMRGFAYEAQWSSLVK